MQYNAIVGFTFVAATRAVLRIELESKMQQTKLKLTCNCLQMQKIKVNHIHSSKGVRIIHFHRDIK